MKPTIRHRSYMAFIGHRLSGLALVLFLPFHFYVLGLALERQEQLDAFLKLSESPLVKFGEWGLVVLLCIHMLFGLRLLVVEFRPWPAPTNSRQAWIYPALVISVLVGLAFLWQAL